MLKKPNSLTRSKIFFLVGVALLGLRLLHFGSEITQPHAWRQCDTAFFARDFFEEGIDLMHPSVCWMGSHKTVVFEFPLAEALMALGYHLAGGEALWVARLITLVFFLGAAFFFYKTLARLFTPPIAELATLLYLAFPLSQYYSTAIHIDFSALFFTHGMVFFFIRGIQEKRAAWFLLSSLMGVLAFLIKAPYAFFLALPLLAYVWHQKQLHFFLRYAFLFLLPVLSFWLWQSHVYRVNAAMPDWDFILHYRKFDDNSAWYFGDLAQRMNWINWKLLIKRWWLDMAGILGTLAFFVGLMQAKKHYFAGLWLLGAGVYVLIFFNLNRIHDYYQLPLLVPVALFMAHGLSKAYHWMIQRGMRAGGIMAAFLALLLMEQVYYAESRYYKVDEELVEIGKQIEFHTPTDALPIVTYRNFDCRNPQILYRAHRKGWSIEQTALNPNVLQRLRDEAGATHLAYIASREPQAETKLYLDGVAVKKIPLLASPDTLFVYRLP